MTTEEKQYDINGFKILPNNFVKTGFVFHLIQRKGDVAIYKKKKEDYEKFNYEVIKIRRHDAMVIGKNKDGQDIMVEKSEQYPCSTEWGQYGWTYLTLDAARTKFLELLSVNQNDVIGKKKRGRPRKIIV